MSLNPLRSIHFLFFLISSLVLIPTAFSEFSIPSDTRVCRVTVVESKVNSTPKSEIEVTYSCSGQNGSFTKVEHLNAKLDSAITTTVDTFIEKGFQIQHVAPTQQAYLLTRSPERFRVAMVD